MLYAKICLNGQRFWRRFLTAVNVIYILPLKKGVTFHLNNLNLPHSRMFCPRINSVVLEKKIFKSFRFFFTCDYDTIKSPLNKRVGPSLILLHKMLCAKYCQKAGSYQQIHHGVNRNQQWPRKASI